MLHANWLIAVIRKQGQHRTSDLDSKSTLAVLY